MKTHPFAPRALSLLAGLALSVMSLDASAQRRPGPPRERPPVNRPTPQRPVQSIDVVFQSLSFSRVGRAWVLDYQLTPASWQAMRNAQITPQLNLHAPDPRRARYELMHSTTLQSRMGRITYPTSVDLRAAQTVEIEVLGENGRAALGRLILGNQVERRLRLVINRAQGPGPRPGRPGTVIVEEEIVEHERPHRPHRPGHPHHPGRPVVIDNRAELIQSCRAHTRFDSDFNSCLSAAQQLDPRFAGDVVRACGGTSSFNSDLLACLGETQSSRGRYNPAEAVRACATTTRFGSDLRKCVGAAMAFPYEPSLVVRACSAHTSFSSELEGCLSRAAMIQGDAVGIVNACGQSTRFNSDFNKCMETSSRAPVRGGRGGVRTTTTTTTTY